jgi:hypothetical protein
MLPLSKFALNMSCVHYIGLGMRNLLKDLRACVINLITIGIDMFNVYLATSEIDTRTG